MGQRHHRAEIERLLSKREREGLTLREIAAESGIPAGTLGWWSARLRAEDPDIARPSELVEVDVVEDGVEQTDEPAIELVTAAGLRVLVPPTASEAHLLRILRVVTKC